MGMSDVATAQQALQMSNGDLGIFLCGSPVFLDYADSDGSGHVLLADEASAELTSEEIERLSGPGMEFWVNHPVTGKQVLVLVQVR